VVLALSTVPVLAAAGPAELPSTEEVLRRIAERAEQTSSQLPEYEYTRTNVTKVFNGGRKLESSEQETCRMILIGGKFFSRLLAKDGRPLSAEETAKEDEREQKFRQKVAEGKGEPEESMFKLVNGETAKRFRYTVIGEDKINERPAYVLTVTPRKDLPTHGIEEKVMAQLAGKFWVDEAENEVVRIDVGLTEPLRIALGIVGALYDFRFSVERERLANGQWANSRLHLTVHFRQLFATKRVIHDETCSDFSLMGPRPQAGRPCQTEASGFSG